MDSDCESAGLSLSLTTTNLNNNNINNEMKSSSSVVSPMIMKFDHFLPCLSLAPAAADDHPISASPRLPSSYCNNNNNNNSGCMKRTTSFDQEEEEGSPRKKLRLTKHQSDVLEDSFKHHSTLNPNQKQALAKQLNLRPRQVEVWFQNRRARTKLKQTENECEELKKQCEKLTEDNKRLQKELHELKNIQLFRLFMD